MKHRLLVYGFAISVALHGALAPLVHAQPTQSEEQKPEILQKDPMPTPPPTPHPTPTPRVTPTPAPTQPPHEKPSTPAPNVRPIKIAPQHTTARTGGITEDPNAHVVGDPNGVPGAKGTAAPAAADASPATPAAAAPTPRPTPTPLSCARPNVPATTVRALEPELPAMAQQQGISGTVAVVVSLDASSRVVGTRVQSSPSNVLNAPALAAARGSQFRTEVKNCEPVAADYIFSVEFTSQ